jgi:polyisoprenoid-binding protein YceI
MLKLFGFAFKLALFSVVVLILGNKVHWKGRSLAEQVNAQMAHAEKSEIAGQMKNWAGSLSTEARDVVRTTAAKATSATEISRSASGVSESGISEKIPPSERQKLRALIRELNGPHGRD